MKRRHCVGYRGRLEWRAVCVDQDRGPARAYLAGDPWHRGLHWDAIARFNVEAVKRRGRAVTNDDVDGGIPF